MAGDPQKSESQQAHMLCVSYDESLLVTRRLLLEKRGYKVTAALGFESSMARCREGGYSLFILGHSIPKGDQQELMTIFREHSKGPVLSLRRPGESAIAGADYYSFPGDPEEFLRLIADILRKTPRSKSSGTTDDEARGRRG
jgi:DNA-binding response OmpR family regulator